MEGGCWSQDSGWSYNTTDLASNMHPGVSYLTKESQEPSDGKTYWPVGPAVPTHEF
ncbi:Ent-kaurene oxidase [Sesbania bispinosa]|nr:Ent-kaurene oxidase [Sesbania bispinosa]